LYTLSSKTIAILLFNICVVTTAQVCLKYGMTHPQLQLPPGILPKVPALVTAIFTRPHVLAGFLLFGASSLMWLNILNTTPLSLAYPTVALSYVLTTFITWRLGEPVNWVFSAPGLFLICCGVTLVGMGFAQRTPR
jgi:drug/metabolite transporter (DMT)-like permease